MPLELRQEIERIHRNLGHASADQLEKLFRDADVSDEAVSALKHFRCDAYDRLKRPPPKRRVAVNHAETNNDIVSMDVNFWKISFKEFPRVKTTLKVLNIVDAASGMHIAIQIADHTAETIWKAFATGWLRWAGSPRCLRVDPHSSQIARGFFDKAEGRGKFVEPILAEVHWQIGQVENNARYSRQMGYKILLGILMCQKATSRHCLASSRMQRTVWCNRMDSCQGNGYLVRFVEFQVICWKRNPIYPIWTLKVDSGGLLRCAKSVGWRRSRQR